MICSIIIQIYDLGKIMATLNISIPDEMRTWIDRQIESGRFANASDYIRDLIRHNQSEKDAIRMALVEGELSGESDLSVLDIIKQQKSKP
jgi:antitoxin ParD1/3/4